jgi:hypothetical protein
MQERKEQKTRPFSLLVTTEKDFVIYDPGHSYLTKFAIYSKPKSPASSLFSPAGPIPGNPGW